jgi:hypothetical protein
VTPFLRWWRFAQAIVESVTAPRTDIAQSDRVFEAQVRRSAGFEALHRVAMSFDRASTTSRLMRAVAAVRREWYAARRDARVRAAGLTITTASATALILVALGPAGIGRFAWLLPLLSLAAGVAAIAAAGPIARALDRAGF